MKACFRWLGFRGSLEAVGGWAAEGLAPDWMAGEEAVAGVKVKEREVPEGMKRLEEEGEEGAGFGACAESCHGGLEVCVQQR